MRILHENASKKLVHFTPIVVTFVLNCCTNKIKLKHHHTPFKNNYIQRMSTMSCHKKSGTTRLILSLPFNTIQTADLGLPLASPIVVRDVTHTHTNTHMRMCNLGLGKEAWLLELRSFDE